jgi:hypothetical protein
MGFAETKEHLLVAQKELAAYRAFAGCRGVLPLVDAVECDSNTVRGAREISLVLRLAALSLQAAIDAAREQSDRICPAIALLKCFSTSVSARTRCMPVDWFTAISSPPTCCSPPPTTGAAFLIDFGSVALADVTIVDSACAKELLEAADRESTPLFRAPELFAMSLHAPTRRQN